MEYIKETEDLKMESSESAVTKLLVSCQKTKSLLNCNKIAIFVWGGSNFDG